ncbi:calcium-dependent protein kinase 7-like [Physcomitrium patens]|uniref:calcium-dependent protein kinase 7-like n=1 Tax=Physcomitrium patens TaxID=3218 RepID=UPI003CCD876B
MRTSEAVNGLRCNRWWSEGMRSTNKYRFEQRQRHSEHLGGEEIDGLKEMFEKLDSDNTGTITFEKLKMGLIEIGSQLTEHEVRMLMEAADVDGNRTLDYGEFVAATVHLQRLDDDDHLRRAFDVFDVNESGFIEVEELREAVGESLMGSSSESDVVQAILSEVDLDKDGRISYEEFAMMMRRGTDWRKASRQYSRDRFNSLSTRLLRDGSLNPSSYSTR